MVAFGVPPDDKVPYQTCVLLLLILPDASHIGIVTICKQKTSTVNLPDPPVIVGQ